LKLIIIHHEPLSIYGFNFNVRRCNTVVFVNDRRPKAKWVWHGLRPYTGLRRAIQINYCKTKTCA